MKIVLQYFDGCPNWEITRRYLRTLVEEGMEATLDYELIDTQERAEERGFPGSPTVLIDGVDPFADGTLRPGLACRVYPTEKEWAGSPTLEQLREAIGARLGWEEER
jgi:hypothetical protein